MSNWKVSKEHIKLFPHPNADKLQIGKVGTYQVVVQKDMYQENDIIVFAPEKSVLTGRIREEYEKYLSGTNHDRVKETTLRGQVSAGIIIPRELWPNDLNGVEIGQDISEMFNISKYDPPIPDELLGKIVAYEMGGISRHDCEQYAIYLNEMIKDEMVVITEKLHGSQTVVAYDFEKDKKLISSKGLLKLGFEFEQDEDNAYTRGVNKAQIFEKIKNNFDSGMVQIFGEIVAIKGGYNYGQEAETIKVFDLKLNGESIPFDQVPDEFKNMWVPVIYHGPLKMNEGQLSEEILNLCKGEETVSGENLHIREGVVIRPYIDRRAFDNTPLRLKMINPAYAKKATGEEIS
jgi:RNA ligase (TIGR02306 family)